MSEIPVHPRFLVLQPYHLSREKARQRVIASLQAYGVPTPNEGWDSLVLTKNHDKPPQPLSFREMLDQARKTGVVERVQKYLDLKDNIFGGTLEDLATPNHQLTLKTEYASLSKESQGPCRSSCVERELMEDILDYRRQVCEHSNEYDFKLCTRYYRAYLSACVSIVDAFINRHILLAKLDGFASPEFDQLQLQRNLGEKVRLWWEVCSSHNSAPFFNSQAWCHFQEIRTKRNELLHAVDPILVYSVKDIQTYLNKVRAGIGELLLLLRKAHDKPSVAFIERLRTAPSVDYQHITFRADGKHEIKITQG